jgi:hypothetical protein
VDELGAASRSGSGSQPLLVAHYRALSMNGAIAADWARAGHRIDSSAGIVGSRIWRATMSGLLVRLGATEGEVAVGGLV